MMQANISVRKREIFLLTVFLLVLAVLIIRVGWIQIVKGDEYQKKAYLHQTQSYSISPKRGVIYDRNGKELAVSASVETIIVDPSLLKDNEDDLSLIVDELSVLLDLDKEFVYKKATSKSMYEKLKGKVEKDVADKVRQFINENNISGIGIYEDTKRYYPKGSLASNIIGHTGDDNQGITGIEIYMDSYLRGSSGKILSEVDAKGREIPFGGESRIDATDGMNVVLTIDETIQHFAEKTLDQAILDYKVVDGAIAIVMDPRNGDVLAMASKPDYDLNDPYAFPEGVRGVDPASWVGKKSSDNVNLLFSTVWRNKAIMDLYEPGSTFKAITTAAGLEEGKIAPEANVLCAQLQLAGHSINCWKHGGHGAETFKEAVYNSCNPVFVKVAQSVGVERFFKYIKAFGFYEETDIMFPGEPKEYIWWQKPQEIDMAVASFGQRFKIAPLQLITAYGAIANGGSLLKPRLIKEITDENGNIVKKYDTEVVRQVISQQTSDTLREILEGVVSVGTGKSAYVRGYRVAGKTGTSEPDNEGGGYVASFSAFAPADNPRICVLVALFNPLGEHRGGVAAAPTAGRLVEDVLNYLEVERTYTELDKQRMMKEVYVPEVRELTLKDAKRKLNEKNLGMTIEGDSSDDNAIVVEQTPKPNASIPEKSVVILYTYKPDQKKKVQMPNVLQKTIIEATEALNRVGLNIKVSGVGVGQAYEQTYDIGTELEIGSVVEVKFMNTETD